MDFEWDEKKRSSNIAKHGVDFADTVAVFEDPRLLIMPDEHHGEERDVAIGMDTGGRLIVVVHTHRKNKVRIISARKATRSEKGQYGEES